MKIGVLTFHRSYNNGAILQAYALVSKLRELGADAEVMDLRSHDSESATRLIKKGEKINIKTPVKVVFRYFRHRRIDSFIKKYIPLSSPLKTAEDFKLIDKEYDRYITGSDQVWNDSIIKGKKCYFLDFTDKDYKKYSYAASISGDVKKAEETVNLYSEYIEKYQKISLRENNIEEYFKSLYGDKVRCDIDPVLLLKKEQWKKIASPGLHKKKYIFMYLVPKSSNIRRFAENLAEKYNCDLIDNKSSKEFFNKCGIEDFISWFLNAEAVVTNSFHGTAFSIIFEKEFYVELNAEIGFNYRANQLMEGLGIKNNEITSSELPEKPVKADYNDVKARLSNMRENSLNYLKEICKCGGKQYD